MDYDILGQRDARWAGHLLGNSKSSTIGGWGCLLTCFAMLNGISVDAMNDWLVHHGGYQAEPRGGYAATFDVSEYDNSVRVREYSRDYLNKPVPGDVLMRIQPTPTRPVIVMVNHIPGVGNVQSHFILGVDTTRNGKWVMLDPWFGDCCTLDRYGANYGVAICEYFVYEVNHG